MSDNDRVERGRRIADAFKTDPDAVREYVCAQPIPSRLIAAIGRAPNTRQLTPAELRALAALSLGWRLPKLSEYTGLSRETLKTQLADAVCKLEARNATHAVAVAIRRRLLD